MFEKIAAGNYNTEQVWKLATKRGLRCSKNNFWLIIKNPVYCGKIVIPQFADEEERLADGLHQPIITRRLFNQVQDQLNGRKKNPFSKPKVVSPDNLPLRGYLTCPECDRTLSGSASKGRHNYYHYYHCRGGCHVRFKAKEVNDQFKKQLRLLIPRPGRMLIYSEMILNEFKDQTQIRARERKTILLELDKLNDRTNSARLKFVDGILESDDFQEIKKQCTTKITELEAALSNLATEKSDVSKIFQQILPKLENIATLYESATVEEKRQIIGSIFPENLVFDGKQVRTARFNAGIELIYQISSKLEIKKNGTNPFKSDLSLRVHPKVQSSNLLLEDLRKLAALFENSERANK